MKARDEEVDVPSSRQLGWTWPDDDSLIDLTPYVLRDWTEHHGDSPITLARPRKPRGSSTLPQPTFLLKKVASAIGERTYYRLARLLNLPSTVVYWADYAEIPVAAIRFEPTAWRPDKVDAEAGTARAGNRVEPLANPLDFYRHLALCFLLGEADDVEFMVRNDVLFRIDAASVGDALWSTAANALSLALTDGASADSRERSSDSVAWIAERLRTSTPQGYAACLDTFTHIALHPDWDEIVRKDLRTCPAHDWCRDWHQLSLEELSAPHKAQVQAWFEVPMMEHIADAYIRTMARQREAIQQLFAETRGKELR